MRSTDLIFGEFYHVTYKPVGSFLIVKNDGVIVGDEHRMNGTYISNMNSLPKFEFKTQPIYFGEDREIRVATPDEKQWLSHCIDKKKFVPKDKIKMEPNYDIY